MSRRLLKQMATEWSSNIWLVVELIVVSVVLWYISDFLYIKADVALQPMGLQTERVFTVSLTAIDPSASDWNPSDSTEDTHADNSRILYERIKADPAVEIAARTYFGVPNEFNLSGTNLFNADDTDSLSVVGTISQRFITPEYIEMFSIRGTNGESPAEMRRIFESGKILATSDMIFCKFPHKQYNSWKEIYDEMDGYDVREMLSRRFYIGSDSTEISIGGIIEPIKRSIHEMPMPQILLSMSDGNALNTARILVKVRPEAIDGFKKHILGSSWTRSGNIYICDIAEVDSLGYYHRVQKSAEIRNHIALMVFVLVSIFLGLLGTFWFRTQQRVGEIAIRKVNGATSRSIFRRLISEGLILLTVATIPALGLDWLLTHLELNSSRLWVYYFEPLRFIACAAFAYLMLALMIVGGIWFPASRAMRVDPAVAIKDE